MHEYGVVIDENMIRNIFETNTAEARDLFAPKMLAAIAALGLLPAFADLATRRGLSGRIH